MISPPLWTHHPGFASDFCISCLGSQPWAARERETPSGRGWLGRPRCSGEMYSETLCSLALLRGVSPIPIHFTPLPAVSLWRHLRPNQLTLKSSSVEPRSGGIGCCGPCGRRGYCSCCQRLRLLFQHSLCSFVVLLLGLTAWGLSDARPTCFAPSLLAAWGLL